MHYPSKPSYRRLAIDGTRKISQTLSADSCCQELAALCDYNDRHETDLIKVFSVKSEMELNSKPVHLGQLTEQHFQMLLWLLDHCESVIDIQPYPSSFDQQKSLGLTFDSQVSLVRELVYIDLISTQVVDGMLNYAFTESFRSNFLSQLDIYKEELAQGNRLKPLLRF